MALALPRFAVFRQNTYIHMGHHLLSDDEEVSLFPPEKYLRYIHEGGELHELLQFSGKEIVSPYSKFEIERAKTAGYTGFVHIKCCYNNKYWVANTSRSDSFIIAGADKPNEDKSEWSCTLSEPILVDCEGYSSISSSSSNTTLHVRFRHVKLGHYLRSLMTGDHYHACLSTSYDGRYYERRYYNNGLDDRFKVFASLTTPEEHYNRFACLLSDPKERYDHFASLLSNHMLYCFDIIDWESLLILPKHIALKGHNDLYLSADRDQYLQFASSDIGDPTVGNEVFITNGGSVRIKNNHFGKFWRRSRNWIRADSDDTTTYDSDTLFYPVKVGDNVIALRNLGNNNFCNSNRNYLKAAVTTVSKEARLEVKELVISRTIYNVNYRLLDARIYNQSIVTMANKTATNDTQESNTAKLKFLRKESKSSTWKDSVSFKLGVKTEIQTGIPIIADGKVEVSAEFSGEYEWGETMSTENQVETEYTITVPPMSKVTVSLLATQGSCDVPYSYTQRDTLMNGRQVIHNFDDGVYTGINSFNFSYQTKQEKL